MLENFFLGYNSVELCGRSKIWNSEKLANKQEIDTPVACMVCTLLTPTLLPCLILNPGATSLATIQQTTDFHLPSCLHSAHMAHPHPPALASRCHVAIGNVATKCEMTNVVILCCTWDRDRILYLLLLYIRNTLVDCPSQVLYLPNPHETHTDTQYFTLPGLFHVKSMEWGVDSMEWRMDSILFSDGSHTFSRWIPYFFQMDVILLPYGIQVE